MIFFHGFWFTVVLIYCCIFLFVVPIFFFWCIKEIAVFIDLSCISRSCCFFFYFFADLLSCFEFAFAFIVITDLFCLPFCGFVSDSLLCYQTCFAIDLLLCYQFFFFFFLICWQGLKLSFLWICCFVADLLCILVYYWIILGQSNQFKKRFFDFHICCQFFLSFRTWQFFS